MLLVAAADDGKIFVGCGVGEPFGPECNKGLLTCCFIDFVSHCQPVLVHKYIHACLFPNLELVRDIFFY